MAKESVFSNVLWKFAERTLAQGITFVVSMVLARLLSPDDYGVVATVTIFITVANVFVTSGIPTALIQKKDAKQEDFSSVFCFNLFFSCALYALIFFCAPWIAVIYKQPQLVPLLRVMGLQILVAAFNSVQSAYVSRNLMFRKYFLSTLLGAILSGAVGITMAYAGCGVWALVAQSLTNITVSTLVLFFTVRWKPSLYFSWKRVTQLLKFGWKILFEGMSATVFGQLYNMVIGVVYTPSDLGYYTKAQQFPNLVVTNISDSISTILFPVVAKAQEDPVEVNRLLRKAARMTAYIVLPMLTGIMLVAKPLVSLLMTDVWLGCVPYIQILCVAGFFTSAMVPRHQALNGVGRSDVYMYEHMAARVVSMALLLMVYRTSVMAIAVSGLVGTVILGGIIAYTSKRYTFYRYREQLVDLAVPLGGCLLMSLCVWPVSLLSLTPFWMLTAQATVGAVVYILYSYFLKVQEFDYLLALITRLIKR